MTESSLPKSLTCLLSRDRESDMWVSHCLDFDLITSGIDEDDAWFGMQDAVKSHVESCFEDNFEAGLAKRATPDEWREFLVVGLFEIVTY